MPSLKGLRVVRGPNWKWDDQDGGEGHVGTVIDPSFFGRYGAETITVLWDTGFRGQYRGGSESYDLRIIDNSMVVGSHPKVRCAGGDCKENEIRGFRWQCATCDINLCTPCFFKEKPHHMDHNLFKRYDHSKIIHPLNVHCWNPDGGPENRTQLLGIYLGAKVHRIGSLTSHDQAEGIDNEVKCGLVVPPSKYDLFGYIRVNWIRKNSKPRSDCRVTYSDAYIIATEVSSGGYFKVDALPVLENDAVFEDESETGLYKELVELTKEKVDLMFRVAFVGNLRIAKMLRFHGMDMDERDSNGMTLLHIACQQGHKDFVDWLVHDIKVDVERADGKGFRAIHYATMKCHLEILKLLIEIGAQLNSRNYSGKTALHVAMSCRYPECIWLLIQPGCKVIIQDLEGNTPFHLATSWKTIPLDIFLALTNLGMMDLSLRNKKGLNILHLAIIRGNMKMIQALIKHYPAQLLETEDMTGRTPFLVASCQHDNVTIDLLIKAGADVSAVDNKGNNAILLAASHLKKKKDVPPKDPSSELKKSSDLALSIIGFLMNRGCSWDQVNSAGMKASDILLSKGFSQDVIEKFATKSEILLCRSFDRMVCTTVPCNGFPIVSSAINPSAVTMGNPEDNFLDEKRD